MLRPSDAASAIPDFDVLQQAAEWFALLSSDAVAESDRSRWQRWLEASPEHRSAWRRVESISRRFESLPVGPARAALNAAGRGRRQALKTFVLFCAAGAAGWHGVRTASWREWMADNRTGVGERREIALADGTRVWLNTASAIDIEYGSALRRIELLAGEILVETAPDTAIPPRPLEVDTGHGRLQALGTRFDVRLEDGACHLAVFDGAVEIRSAVAGSAVRILRAGQQTRFTRDGIDAPVAADTGRAAWARGLLLADDMRLGDFVAELSRYRRGYLGCAPGVANLRIVGAFPLGDTDRVLAALESTLPVKIHAVLPWWVTVGPR